MRLAHRFGMGLLATALIVGAGCDKSATSSSGSNGGGGGTADPKAIADAFAKRLHGTWESTGDKKDEGTLEFKADGNMKMSMGPLEMAGTWKVTKAEGKTGTVETELKPEGDFEKLGKKEPMKIVLAIDFDDMDTMTATPTDKKDPKNFKRKK